MECPNCGRDAMYEMYPDHGYDAPGDTGEEYDEAYGDIDEQYEAPIGLMCHHCGYQEDY